MRNFFIYYWALMFISSICLNLQSQESEQKHVHSFEQALLELREKKPYLFTIQTYEKSGSHLRSNTYESGKKIINAIALISAFLRIYAAHQKIDQTDDDGWYDKTLTLISPRLITRIARQSIFFKESIEIALETIMFKTIAKLILYCGTKDGIDCIKDSWSYVISWFITKKEQHEHASHT